MNSYSTQTWNSTFNSRRCVLEHMSCMLHYSLQYIIHFVLLYFHFINLTCCILTREPWNTMLLLLTYHVTSTINVSHISISPHEIYIKRPLIYFTFWGTAPITMLCLNVPLKDKVKPRLEVVNTFSSTQKRECWDEGGYKMK